MLFSYLFIFGLVLNIAASPVVTSTVTLDISPPAASSEVIQHLPRPKWSIDLAAKDFREGKTSNLMVENNSTSILSKRNTSPTCFPNNPRPNIANIRAAAAYLEGLPSSRYCCASARNTCSRMVLAGDASLSICTGSLGDGCMFCRAAAQYFRGMISQCGGAVANQVVNSWSLIDAERGVTLQIWKN